MRSFLLFFLLLATGTQAQDITGAWHGTLDIAGTKLRLVLHIDQDTDGLKGRLDSPDQHAEGIPVGSLTFSDKVLTLDAPIIKARYTGTWEADTLIRGTFLQGGMSFPLLLTKRTAILALADRPQEPKAPFPYVIEEVSIPNTQAQVTLGATLTKPTGKGPFPAVILISGSGPQNRDEELLGHKPFWIIADYLTRQGMAVLRYDDRGVGVSTGTFSTATTADFATDAAAVFAFLKNREEILPEKIGFLGHSEGGVIAPLVAAKNRDVAFLLLLAAPGIPVDSLLLIQNRLLAQAAGQSAQQLDSLSTELREVYKFILQEGDRPTFETQLTALLSRPLNAAVSRGALSQEQANATIQQQKAFYNSPWTRYLLAMDPGKALQQVKCPVLALNGSLDLQVSAKENLNAIANALQKAGNQQITVKELARLNHLFQESTSGSPAEYAQIAQTFSPVALQEILQWLKAYQIL